MASEKVVDIAIIGAGPGGMACAIEAKLAGIDNIMVIDKASTHNDMIHKFYKRGKRVDKDWMGRKAEFEGNVSFDECSKEEYIKQMDDLLASHGVLDKFVYDTEIWNTVKGDDGLFIVKLSEDEIVKAKNVIVSVGRMGKPNKPGYKFPKAIRPRLNFNLSKVCNGERVMIVGGGDTAGEYAYGLVELDGMEDCTVTLNYRKPTITRMNPMNTEMTTKHLDDGTLINKMGVDVESVEPVGNEGEERVQVNFTDGTNEVYERLVFALGGTSPKDFLVNSKIETGKWDEPLMNEKTLETNISGLYTIGDVVTDQGSIALAFNHASFVMNDIVAKRK
ncbi:MAG: Thioredoxin reductase (EC [uncultured Sulfurovum sp.]|uniref:Thioredoxin reductase (EC) n=1 Tax=uncultured Sulfurovum sp. TaxID=269237 RepID=A0A6S6TKC0_9BACT|nr:MAG: Thioredoxin reductase (EC [uncultured Sulfurovum sp.]